MKETKILREHFQKIHYSEDHWNLLRKKRKDAKKLLQLFNNAGLRTYLFGSIARGDVHEDSDIDLFITDNIPSYQIEIILQDKGYSHYYREIIMATPNDTLKLYIYLSELESITIPLSKFDRKSLEFYAFGGKIEINQLYNDIRVPGVDKRLVFINPTEYGHEEYSIIGNEHLIAKQLNVSIDIVNERKKVLLRRESFGRTGVFLKRELSIQESVEEVLKELSNRKSIIRKKLYKK